MFSNLTDKYGKKGIMLMTAGILSVIGYVVMYFVEANMHNNYYVAILPIAFIGVWFGLYQAAYWPSISIIVSNAVKRIKINAQLEGKEDSTDDRLSGVAFGITNTINNIGLACFPILYGYINTPPSHDSYKTSTLFMIMQAAVGA